MSGTPQEYKIPSKAYARSWSPANLTSLSITRSLDLAKDLYWPSSITQARRGPWLSLDAPKFSSGNLPYFSSMDASAASVWAAGLARTSLLHFSKWISAFAPYSRSLIIRGIGYRLYPLINLGSTDAYSYSRYVYLRAGHSYPTFCGVPSGVGIKTYKRERKLLIYGYNNTAVGLFSDRLFYYRPPNAFTGRGIRFKAVRYKRKPGKRAQKGRGF